MLTKSQDKETRMKLLQFVRKHGNSVGRFLVLQFWGKHPRAYFSLPCICSAMGGKRFDPKETLEMLVEDGIVEARTNPQGVTLYCLTANPEKREPVVTLGQLDWEQAQKLSFLAAHRWPTSHVLAQA